MSDLADGRRLFAEYASGAISAEQLQSLEAALRADAEWRREFIEYMNIDAALGDLAALSKAEVAEIEAVKQEHELETDSADTSVSPTLAVGADWRIYRIAAISGAIVVTLLLATILWIASPVANSNAPVATLVLGVDAALIYDGKSNSNSDLLAGEYQLERGLVHLRFGAGVTVYVEAPARFAAVSASRVVLHSGRLSASVPSAGVGFTVETPAAEVVDFGTQFSLDVADGASEVHVFEGLVRVQPRSPSGTKNGNVVALRTAQAVVIDNTTEQPVEIELATDRFIRTFDESPRRYSRTVKQLSPVAFYRMAIRDQGLACLPPKYSGEVLTGVGSRPPHARGVFAGGSLRVLADSTGRGGRVETAPPLRTGQFTLTAFVYLESRARNGMVVTNLHSNGGNFALGLNEKGILQATLRNSDGVLQSVAGDVMTALNTWCHVVVTVDGKHCRVYEDGDLVVSAPCLPLADSVADVLWFGTDATGQNLWDGRIDEVALFDRALSDAEVTHLYRTALEEIGKSE